MREMSWFTYILECKDGSYYVGITNDLLSRLDDHNRGEGSTWTRVRIPMVLRYAERHPDKSGA